jgi:cell pole-organizing protein PopZ
MTQPAKVQEPSMEEILASIRRIIADDEAKPPEAKPPEAKPPVAEKPASPAAPAKPAAPAPAAKPAAPADVPAAAKPAPAPAKPAPPPPAAPAPAPAASNSQDDIDALLNGLDEATVPEEIRPPLPDGDVFELTDDMAVAMEQAPPPPPPQASFQKVDPQDDLEFAESAARAAPRQPAYEPPPFESAAPVQQMLSHTTVSAVESAFNSLANTVLSNNARTLEDLVKEMLRPMLKSWLDDNLPGLVERIVKAEIERVSRGGR